MLCINPCSVCSEMYDVFWYCKTCKIYLCNTCKTKHLAKKKRQGHTVVERKRNIKIFKAGEQHRPNSTVSLFDRNSDFAKEMSNPAQTLSKCTKHDWDKSPFENALINPDHMHSLKKVPKRLDHALCFSETIFTNIAIEEDEKPNTPAYPCKYHVFSTELTISRHRFFEVKGILKCHIHWTIDCNFVCIDCKVSGCDICLMLDIHSDCMQVEIQRESVSLAARINDTQKCLRLVQTCLLKENKFLHFLCSTKIDKRVIQLLFLCDNEDLISSIRRKVDDLERTEKMMASNKRRLESYRTLSHDTTLNIYHFLETNLHEDVFQFDTLREQLNRLETWSVDNKISHMKAMNSQFSIRKRDIPHTFLPSNAPKHHSYPPQHQVVDVDLPNDNLHNTICFVLVIFVVIVAFVVASIRTW